MRTVLFICTGNTCRSPMAEAIARHWANAEGLDGEVFVASAGVTAAEGGAISAETLRSLNALGIEHEGRSKPLTADMVEKADLVLCMTAEHVAAVRALVPGADDGKVQRLAPDADLEDPIGRGQEAYDRLAERLKALIPQRLKEALVR